MIRVASIFCLIALALFGCRPAYLSPQEVKAYSLDEDNGLLKSVAVDQTKINVLYRPTDLLVHQEIGDEKTDSITVKKLRQKYGQYLYFILSLSAGEHEALHQTSGAQYSDLVQTLSFRMPEYVTMTTSANDTIPVADFMLNRTYGMNSATDILFVFSSERVKDKEWIQFNLNEFGLRVGNQRFRFDMKDLQNVPEVSFGGV